MEEIRLQIPSQADYIDVVRVCLYGIATKIGFSYEDIEDMKVAVSEACNNAVLHGSQASENNSIEICFKHSDAKIVIKIKNKGSTFAHNEALDKANPLPSMTNISDLPIGGLGLYLMQALMDEVSVETRDLMTEVTLMKSIKQ
ncbi:anti-sigma B factor RsbW [Paenibacillus sp. GCM10027626]|uniref:anti-sigma B factor RsbW n=1 Tax=Paenibacillus sp. GCM10027626 TaxID=3273411 RepID=UPI003635DD27